MKHLLSALATIFLLFVSTACTLKDFDGGNQNSRDEITITGEVLDVTDYSATFTGYANLSHGLWGAEAGIMYDKNRSFEDGKKIVASNLDGNNKFMVSTTNLESNTTYYFKSFVENETTIEYGTVKSFTTKESKCPKGAVDLGIVITRKDGSTYKLYWAKSNLSTSGLCANPEDYGDYFVWYLVEPPTMVNLGGKWRLPTFDEWLALLTNCTSCRWTTLNGVKGRLLTARNGNSIFLPAAGYRYDTHIYDAGSAGTYWSSSISTEYSYDARYVLFDSGPVSE